MIARGWLIPLRARPTSACRVFIRFNQTKKNVHFQEINLVKNKNNFGDQLESVLDGKQPYGQMALENNEKIKTIVDTTNFGEEETKTAKNPQIPAEPPAKNEQTRKQDIDAKLMDPLVNPDLPSNKENKRSQLAKRLEKYFDSLQDTIFTATRTLNDVTGYSAIEKLKNSIEDLESQLKNAREQVKTSKENYNESIHLRSKLQKEVNELLTRKHNWTPEDLERFTNLYRSDHVNEQHEAQCSQALEKSERLVDSIQLKLTQQILARYHEEQIWSDKIRRASTYGTWGIMCFNLLLFIVATFLVEPWKRSRLVSAFEEKVKAMLFESSEHQTGKIDELIQQKQQQLGSDERAEESKAVGIKSWLFKDTDTDTDNFSSSSSNSSSSNTASDSSSTASFFGAPAAKASASNTAPVPLSGTWDGVRATYTNIMANDTLYLRFSKLDFSIFMAASLAVGMGVGSAVSFLFVAK